MFRELLGLFRSDDPVGRMAKNFAKMLRLGQELTVQAGEIYFGSEPATPEQRSAIYRQDVKINKLERKIRKRVLAHLAIASHSQDVPYCLLLMSLVKDAERIGDYAKNLAELDEIYPQALPEDDIVAELREIRAGVEYGFSRTLEAFANSDTEGAVELIREGRDFTHRCDVLVSRIAHSDYNAGTTAATILGARYYKRIAAHALNILSAVVMSLHKLDYYDERVLTPEEDDDE
jgi:phosphate transport system protein